MKARDDLQKKDIWKLTGKKKRKIIRCKKEVNNQFGRKMNQDSNRNRKRSRIKAVQIDNLKKFAKY